MLIYSVKIVIVKNISFQYIYFNIHTGNKVYFPGFFSFTVLIYARECVKTNIYGYAIYTKPVFNLSIQVTNNYITNYKMIFEEVATLFQICGSANYCVFTERNKNIVSKNDKIGIVYL
jgi:hypothetical protein